MERILDFFNLTPPIAGAQHVSPLNFQALQDLVKNWKIEKLTSFYISSPFRAIISEKDALRSLIKECHSELKRGMLIACLLRKPI
jgi:hypothetical protein